MDVIEWAFVEIWPLGVTGVVVIYLISMVRMANVEPRDAPEKPPSLAGFDVEWCATCSIWVPAKTPWCGVKGCARPHRLL
ncbi:MAG: hypothetical protein HY059_23890 [Proteobacteria bacterium]|nr:hypothetical protein [Pseudomonadota bacterium]